MKQLLIILTAILLTTIAFLPRQASAQSPEKMKYQAVARDNAGNVLSNQLISFRISILQGSSTGASVYTETHQATTNDFGLANLNIGNGSIVSGDFTSIAWSADLHFLKVEMDPAGGSAFQLMGTSQLLSVPYSLYSETSGNAGASEINELADGRTVGNSVFLGSGAGVNDDGTNNYNVAVGDSALTTNTSGFSNTANGYKSLYSNTTGIWNTANGSKSLYSNTTGDFNTANGNKSLYSNTTGFSNTANGYKSLYSNTTGVWNTANGSRSLSSNTTGFSNTAYGSDALYSNVAGNENTATGYQALHHNTQSNNTANGHQALHSNTNGVGNTASGHQSLYSNTMGNNNTANGSAALYSNIDGHWNTAMGTAALYNNETGNNNTAIGWAALTNNTDGNENTATGRAALFSNTSGDFNTANGKSALYYNTIGAYNTATGYKALVDNTEGHENTAIGYKALYNNTEGNFNTAVGSYALSYTTGSNNIGIGDFALVPSSTASNQVRIGNTSVSHAGIQVSWSITSDEIWKEQIRELPYGLDMLMRLKPVDYYRKNNDIKTREMGFIAQDVEVLLKQMGYDDQGFLTKADNGKLSLRYNDFIALLTKGMQEQQEIIDELKSRIEELEKNK